MLPSETVLYWGEGCPKCAVLETYFAANAPERLAHIIRKEVFKNRENHEELHRAGKAYGIPAERIGVPFLAMREKYLMGNASVIAFLEDQLPD